MKSKTDLYIFGPLEFQIVEALELEIIDAVSRHC